jgi:hypothetical protein
MGISPSALRVAWYRFRCTLRARWSGYLALTLLLGLIGGLAIGSVAAARRTQGAYPAYLAATSPSDLTVLTGLSTSQESGYDPAVIAKIAALPGVRHVASYALVNVAILGLNGAPVALPFVAGELPGSVDGAYFTTDRVTVVQGRLPDLSRPDEIAIDDKGTPSQVHVGTAAELGFYSSSQLTDLYAGKTVKPAFRQKVTVVGAVVYSAEQTQDDIDTQRDGGALFTPALTKKLLSCCVGATETAIQLAADGPGPGGTAGPAAIAAAEARIQQVLPPGFPIEFYVTADTAGKAQRAIAPTSIALAVFGGIAAVAALVIGGQLIGRQQRLGAADRRVLRALGASRVTVVADGLPGICAAIATGALLACVVAVALSPFSPLGSVRQVYPHRGVTFDWPVLGAGAGLLVIVCCLLAVMLAWRQARRLGAAQTAGEARPGLGASIARAARAAGLPVATGEGIRLALDPGGEADSVPLRSVILGTGLAVIVAVASVTFGASLATLVAHPALYGWNWTFDVSSGQSVVNRDQAARVLDSDPAVAAWTGIWYGTASIDGQTVPVLGMTPDAAVTPPVLSGHGLAGPDEVVLGAATLAALHKHVGDVVTVTDGGPPFSLRIAGTATLPSLGVQVTVHTEMGTGAVFDYLHIPGDTAVKPDEILVTLKPGADAAAAKARLQRLVPADQGGVISTVQRPAEITDYQAMGIAPTVLAGTLALGAIASLWLTLMASVRRRRRALALLKTFGFTRRQLAATVTWQAVTAVLAGVIPGIPLGIALGRLLWGVFARDISVVPAPAVPALEIILIGLGALAFASLVALWPGRVAGRTPAATLLRAELGTVPGH